MIFFGKGGGGIILWPLSKFGTRYYLMKGPQKSFEDLTLTDIARMIDAYLNGENDYFYEYAFSEFIILKFKNEFVDKIRIRSLEITERAFTRYEKGGSNNEIGRPELEVLMAELYAMDDDFSLNAEKAKI